MKKWPISVFMIVSLVLLQWGPVISGEDNSDIDPKVREIIENASEYLAGLDHFSMEITAITKNEAEGMKAEMTQIQAVSIERPNKMASRNTFGYMGSTLVMDGESIYSYTNIMNSYTKNPAPSSLDDYVTNNTARTMGSLIGQVEQLAPIVTFFIREEPKKLLLKDVKEAIFLGRENIDGAPCCRLQITDQYIDWDIWIEEGDRPFIRRISGDATKRMMEQRAQSPIRIEMKLFVDVRYDQWNPDPEFDEKTFVFTPPEGAKEGPDMGGMVRPVQEDSNHPLVGQPAPEITLDLLDGTQFNLADQKGNKVVILDFWATWNAHCRENTPMLAEIEDAYKDEGVVLIAINQGESDKAIRGFLEEEGLKINAARDLRGEAGKQFQIAGFPQTVLIGKDGIVKSVFVGFIPERKEDRKNQITAKLDELCGPGASASNQKTQGSFSRAADRGRAARAQADIRSLKTAIAMFQLDNNAYPKSLGDSRSIGDAGIKIGSGANPRIIRLTTPIAYLSRIPADPFDPEGKPYRYFFDGKNNFVIVSNGPNREPDFDERTYKGQSIDELSQFLYDPKKQDGDSGDIIFVGP